MGTAMRCEARRGRPRRHGGPDAQKRGARGWRLAMGGPRGGMRKGWRVVASWRRRGCGKESGDCRCARAFSNSVLPCSAPTPVTVSPVVTCMVEAWGARASVSRPPKLEAQEGSTEKRLAGAPTRAHAPAPRPRGSWRRPSRPRRQPSWRRRAPPACRSQSPKTSLLCLRERASDARGTARGEAARGGAWRMRARRERGEEARRREAWREVSWQLFLGALGTCQLSMRKLVRMGDDGRRSLQQRAQPTPAAHSRSRMCERRVDWMRLNGCRQLSATPEASLTHSVLQRRFSASDTRSALAVTRERRIRRAPPALPRVSRLTRPPLSRLRHAASRHAAARAAGGAARVAMGKRENQRLATAASAASPAPDRHELYAQAVQSPKARALSARARL
jgi:hypothetical protein